MHGYPYPQWRIGWPCFIEQSDLNSTGSGDSVRGATEYRKPAVTLAARSHYMSTELADQGFDQRIVPCKGDTHGVRVPDPSRGAGLDVGEQESNSTTRQLCRSAGSPWR
jgi:hypothetical protein